MMAAQLHFHKSTSVNSWQENEARKCTEIIGSVRLSEQGVATSRMRPTLEPFTKLACLTILVPVLVLQIQCRVHGRSDACRLSDADLFRDVSLLFAMTLSGSWLHRANRHLARFWEPCKLEACNALSWAYICMPTRTALHRHMHQAQIPVVWIGYPWSSITSHPVIGHTCTVHQPLLELHHRCNLETVVGHEFVSMLICICCI